MPPRMSRPLLEAHPLEDAVDDDRQHIELRRQQVPLGRVLALVLLLAPLVAAGVFVQRRYFTETSTDSLDEIRERAAAQHRRVALFFIGSDCLSCVRMRTESWEDPGVAEVVDRSVMLWTIEPDQPGHAALREEYGVTEVPSVVLLSASGSVLLDPAGNPIRRDGFLGPDELRELLETPTRRGARRTTSMASEARLAASSSASVQAEQPPSPDE